ncbi:MAG: extracellular solute-binding protein [Hyphomicrobiales bacterium]|nr:extracellular solute-binding protein [Hyphomicrobiales bacterium]
MRPRSLLRVLPVLLVTLGAALPGVSHLDGSARAQTPRVADVTALQGSEREPKLVEGAKREKELTFYSAIPPDDIAALAAAFDKRYGIKVKVWRADSESLLQRIVSEHRAKRYEVDIVAASSSALEPLAREGLLQDAQSPQLADIVPEGIGPDRQWVAVYFNTIVQAYNTYLVKKESLPARYADLLRPEWRGKLGIEAEDYDWFAQVVLDLGESTGVRLFRDIVASNGISVRKGHNLLANLVVNGEVPLGLTVYGATAEQMKRKGSPIDWLAIPPAIARPNAEGLARNAPHPHAAVLFYDFLLGEGQQILASRYFVPASRKVESSFKGPFKVIDTAAMLEQSRRWQELYQRTIIGPSR